MRCLSRPENHRELQKSMKPPPTPAYLKPARDWGRGVRVRKQVYELTLDDLGKFPVWEFRMDQEGGEGRAECPARPYPPSGPLAPAERMFVVRAVFTLADGSRMHGYCTPPL